MNPLILSKLAELRNVSLKRATNLRERASSQDQTQQRWMSLALQELDVAHEELRVIEEELHTQSEELTSAYEALEFERRRYRDLFEGAPEPYIVTDASGVVLEANHLARGLLNIDSAFVIGKPLALYVWGEDRQLMRDVLDLLIATDEVSSFELHMRPRGAAAPVRATASVRRARDEGGNPAGLRWILHEHHPVRGNGTLHAKLAAASQRGAQTAEQSGSPDEVRQQLEDSLADALSGRAEAERELERRDEQLAFVAHELRNPLNTTAGWLEILNQDDTALASRQHVVDVLARNVKTLARLVEELVDQTRVAQAQVVLECEDIDFRALIERICDDAHGLAHAKHLKFTSEIDASIASLHCDPHRVQQAITNVIGNAVKFTPGNGGAVQLTAAVRGDALECTVRDSGPGIAPEHLTTIFDPFTRVNAHGSSPGLGLGLSIARKLIELHGGSIHAESAGLGEGASFRIRLPLVGPRVLATPPAPSPTLPHPST
ncbi:MAG TPA: ATP-binding protein [Polyangiales bacterium]|nr:ATP-binding protein [Polyangiales bacterium]